DPEAGAKARFAKTENGSLSDMVERVAEPHRGRGFAFARRGGIDRGYQNQLAVGPIAQRTNIIERDLRLVSAAGEHGGGLKPELFGRNLANRSHRRGLGNHDVGFRVSVLFFSARHGVSPRLLDFGS